MPEPKAGGAGQHRSGYAGILSVPPPDPHLEAFFAVICFTVKSGKNGPSDGTGFDTINPPSTASFFDSLWPKH